MLPAAGNAMQGRRTRVPLPSSSGATGQELRLRAYAATHQISGKPGRNYWGHAEISLCWVRKGHRITL